MPHAAPPRTVAASVHVLQCWARPLKEPLRHSQAGLAQSSVGCNAPFPASGCTQGFSLCPLRVSSGYGAWFKCDCTPPTVLLRLLLCPWTWGIFFVVGSNNGCLAVFSQGKISVHPSTLHLSDKVLYREFYSIFCNNLNGERIWEVLRRIF